MPALLLIAAITFNTQSQCVQYHDSQSTNRPAYANITYLNMTTTIIELHGGPEYAVICINEQGENEVFETEKAAAKYTEYCQGAIIVEVD